MPIYQVRQKEGGSDVRLVDAKNGVTALKHVTGDMFEVELCDGKDLFRLAANGVELEIADPEPPQGGGKAEEPEPPAANAGSGEIEIGGSSRTDEFGEIEEDLNAERASREG